MHTEPTSAEQVERDNVQSANMMGKATTDRQINKEALSQCSWYTPRYVCASIRFQD